MSKTQFDNSNWYHKIHNWLIQRLVGKKTVILNANIKVVQNDDYQLIVDGGGILIYEYVFDLDKSLALMVRNKHKDHVGRSKMRGFNMPEKPDEQKRVH